MEVNAAPHTLVTSCIVWMGCLVISPIPHCLREGHQVINFLSEKQCVF